MFTFLLKFCLVKPKNIFRRRLSNALYPLILPNNYGIISNKSRLRLFSL